MYNSVALKTLACHAAIPPTRPHSSFHLVKPKLCPCYTRRPLPPAQLLTPLKSHLLFFTICAPHSAVFWNSAHFQVRLSPALHVFSSLWWTFCLLSSWVALKKLNTNSHPCPSLQSHPSTPISMEFRAPGTSCTCDFTVFIPLCLLSVGV